MDEELRDRFKAIKRLECLMRASDEEEQKEIRKLELEFEQKYKIKFPEKNRTTLDIIVNNNMKKYDYIIGNPPWINFNDIGNIEYKEILKQYYIKYGLVKNLKEVLLGGSRIDLAALILYSVFLNNTKDTTICGYYLPLSLFLNDGASESFRSYTVGNKNFSLDYLYDFDGIKVFDGISTRFCFAQFSMSRKTKYPINYFISNENN
jgi:hypothetical protein